MSKKNYDYKEKMNKNKSKKEKSLKVLYSTVAAYGLATVAAAPNSADAAELDAGNNQENKESQAKQAATPEETAAVDQTQSVEVVDAKEYLGQVAGEIGLKNADAPEESELNQALNESYEMINEGNLAAEKAEEQAAKLREAENNHSTSETTSESTTTEENKKEVESTESAATDSTSTSSQNKNSEQTNSSTTTTTGKEETSSEKPVVSTGNKELDKKLADLEKLGKLDDNYSKESVEALNKIVKDLEDKVAKGELTEAEANKALANLDKAMKNLSVDKKPLDEITKQLELDLLNLGSINQEKSSIVKEILEEAKALQVKEGVTQAEINQLVEKLTQHAEDLDISSEDLTSHVDKVMDEYKQLNYTALSYKQLNDALRDALMIANNSDSTQSERYLAYKNIDDALLELVQIRTAGELQSKLDEVVDIDGKSYTSDSYKKFSESLRKAQKVMAASEVSTDTYSNVYHELMKSINDLVSKDDVNESLQATMEEANKLLNDNKKKQVYTNETLDILLKQLKVAETVDFSQVSADRLVEINNNLKRAMSDLIEIENLKGLESLINEGNKLVGLGKGKFTETSWNSLNKQLAYAEAVISNSKSTVDEISRAYKNLDKAIEGMVDRESLLKDLDNLLFKSEAYQKDKDKFTESSWLSFENALIKAKAINRDTISPDILNSLVNELAMTMNHLYLSSNEAVSQLQKELERLVTLDKETAYTTDSWRNLQRVVQDAYKLIDSGKDIKTETVLSITESLTKAIDELAYSQPERQAAKKKLQDEISAFDNMTAEEKQKILHGYEEYANSINSARELLYNLNLSVADMNATINKIELAKNNLTLDEGSLAVLINTGSSVGKKTGMKDGKLNVEVNSSRYRLEFLTYKPAFETTIKIPHNLIPFFENEDWRKYAQISYNNSAMTAALISSSVQSGNKKSGGVAGIGATWDPTLNLLNLDDPKVLEDLNISYKIVNGQPVLYITTNKMIPGTGLVPVADFDLNYYFRFDLEGYIKDGHALPIQEKIDDKEITVVSKVLQEGILGSWNGNDSKNIDNLGDMNKLDVQDEVNNGDIYTHVVDGTNTIVGKAKQTNEKHLESDKYQAVFELNGKEIGRADLDKNGNFVYNYTIVDSKTGNVVAQNFKQGDQVKVTVVRVNEKYDLVTSSTDQSINVVKGKSPKVTVNPIKQNGKVISGKITTLTTQDGKSMDIDPSDKNVYTVRLVYYAPGQSTGIELAEVRTDKNGNFSYVTSMPLQYGGRIEALGYVYQGIVNSNGELSSAGIQMNNSDASSTVKLVEWNIGKPSVNQIKEGSTTVSGQAPVNDVKFNEANYKVQVTIGEKTYFGDIDDNGMFTVTVPKVERGDIVNVSVVGFVPGETKSVTGSEVVESVVVATSEANDKWEVNVPTINPPKVGESTLTGIVLLDDSPTRKYYLTVTVNGVEMTINEDALNRENGRIQINLDQKIKATDEIVVTLHGSEKGYDGEKSVSTPVEVKMPESFENWEISHPVVKDPQIGDKSVSGYVAVDSSYDRSYYVQVRINKGKVITGEVDKYGNFKVELDKGLEAYDDISVIIVGQQGDAGKKESAENLKRVPAKNTEVNKNGLEAAIDVASFYSNDNKVYTQESFDVLAKALEDANVIFKDESMTQKQVNQARDILNNAISSLVTVNSVKPTQVTLDALESLLKDAERLSPSKYSGTTYKVLVDSMEQAKQALVDETSTQTDIESMLTLLSNSMEQLKSPSITDPSAVDQKRLEDLIASSKKYKGSDYTQYSFSVLQEAIRKGDEALGNPNAATLNSSFNEIKRAIDGLVPVVSVGEEGREQLLGEIADAKVLKDTDYTTASYDKLQTAILFAEKIYDNKNSSVEELSEARNQLLQAKVKLVGKDDLRKQLSIAYVEAKDAIAKQKLSYYTTKTYSAMNEAYKQALEFDKNRKATANELDKALKDLQFAIDKLVPSSNIETLDKLIDEASVIISKPNEKWKFTTKTWNELNIQLHNAKDILAASESSMEDISIATNELGKALNNLVSKEDLLGQLDIALESGKTVNPTDYSYYDGKDTALNESYQEFKKIFEKASKLDRAKIEADDLSKLINELNQGIAGLVTTKEEANKKLNETLEKAKTSGITSDSSHPNDLYKDGFKIKNNMKNAESILKDPKAIADDIYEAEKALQEALDNATYADEKANETRAKIDKHIAEFSKLKPKDYVIGYDDYKKVIESSNAELHRNYGLTLDELTNMLTVIETAKSNVIKAKDPNFVTMGNTTSNLNDVSIKDGKLTFRAKSKQTSTLAPIAVYTPSFETRIELPKSMKVVFESDNWRDYVYLDAKGSVGVLLGTTEEFKVDKVKLSDLEPGNVTVEYYLSADGVPTLRIITKTMATSILDLAPQTWFALDYGFDIDLATWSRDHNSYVPLNTEDDNTMHVITELNKKPWIFVGEEKEGISNALNNEYSKGKSNGSTTGLGSDKTSAQKPVASAELGNVLVSGGTVINGRVQQDHNTDIKGDAYKVRIDIKHKDGSIETIGYTDVNDDNTFMFVYGEKDEFGNVTAKGFKDGDVVLATVIRENKGHNFESQSTVQEWQVGKAKAPEVTLNPIKNGSQMISGNISGMMDEKGNYVKFNPNDLNVYKVKLTYYSPDGKAIQLSEVSVDRQTGAFEYYVGTPLEFGGYIEAQAFVYAGKLNNFGTLVGIGKQLQDVMPQITQSDVEWGIPDPLLNQAAEGDTSISGLVPNIDNGEYKIRVTVNGKVIDNVPVTKDGLFKLEGLDTPLQIGDVITAQLIAYRDGVAVTDKNGKELASNITKITVKNADDLYEEWKVRQPAIDDLFEGKEYVTGIAPNDNALGRSYDVVVTVNGTKTYRGKLDANGKFMVKVDTLKAGDKVEVQVVGHQPNKKDKFSDLSETTVQLSQDWADWKLQPIEVKQPSANDNVIMGKSINNDFSNGRTYTVEVQINGGATYTGELNADGTFSISIPTLSYKDEVTIKLVGHQAGYDDKIGDTTTISVGKEDKVDKSKLQNLYSNVKNTTNTNHEYTAQSYKEFDKARENAKFVLEDLEVTQEQVDEAYKLLKDAFEKLEANESTEVDKTQLEKVYEDTNPDNPDNDNRYSNDDEKYPDDIYSEFEEAREKAKEILDDPEATQVEVDEAVKELEKAKENLDNYYDNNVDPDPDGSDSDNSDSDNSDSDNSDNSDSDNSDSDNSDSDNSDSDNSDSDNSDSDNSDSDNSDSDNSDSDNSDSDNSDSDNSDSDNSDSDNSDSDNSDSDNSDSDNSDSDNSDSDNSDSDNSDSDNSDSDNSDSDNSDSDNSDSDNSDSDNSDSDNSDSDNSDSDNSDSDNSDSDNSDSDNSDSDNSDSDNSDSDNSDSDNSDSDNSDSDNSDSDNSDSDNSDSDNSDSDNSDSDNSDSDNSDSDNSDSDNSDSDNSDSDNSDSDNSDSDNSDSDNSDSDNSDSDNSDSDNSDSDNSDSDNSDSDNSDSDNSDSDNSDSDNSDSDNSDSDNSDSDNSDSDNSDSDNSDSDNSDSDNSDSDNSDSDNSDSDNSDSDNSDSDNSDSDNSDSDNSDSDNSDSDNSDSDNSDSDNSDSDNSDSDNSDSDNSDSDNSDSDNSDSDNSDSDNSDSDNSDSDNSDSDNSDSDNSDSDNSDSDNSDSDNSDSDNSDSDNSDSDNSDSDNSDSDNSDSDNSDSDNSDSDNSDSDNSDSDNSDSDNSDSDNSDSDNSDSDNSDSDNSDSDNSDSDNSDSDNSDSDNSDSDNSDSDNSDSDNSDSDNSDSDNSDSDNSDSDNSDSDNSDSDNSDSDNSDSDNSDSDNSDSDNSDSDNSDSDNSDSDNSDSDNSDSDNSDSDNSDSDNSDSDNSDSDNSDSDNSDSDNSDSDNSDSDNSDSDNSDSDNSDSDNSDSDNSDSDNSDSDNSDSDNSDSDNSDSDNSDSDNSDSDNSDSDNSDSDNSDSDNSDSDNSDSDNSDSDNSDSDNSDSDNSDSDNSDSDNSDSDNSDSDNSDSDNSDSDNSDSDNSDSDNSDSDNSDSDNSDSDNSDSDNSDSDNSDSDNSDSDNSDSDNSDSDNSDSDNSDSDNSDSDNSDSDNSDSDNSDSDNSDSDNSDSDNSDSDNSDSDNSDSDNSDSDNSDSDNSDSDNSDSDNSDSGNSDSDNSDSDNSDSDNSDSDNSDSDNSDSDNSDSDNSDSDNSDSDNSDSDNSDSDNSGSKSDVQGNGDSFDFDEWYKELMRREKEKELNRREQELIAREQELNAQGSSNQDNLNNKNGKGSNNAMPMAYNPNDGAGSNGNKQSSNGGNNPMNGSNQNNKLPQTGEYDNSAMTTIGLGALLGASALFFRKKKEEEESQEG